MRENPRVDRDDDVRMACFLALDVLRAQLGDELPYKGGLDRGFAFRGRRVPFLNYQKGIYRAGVQRGAAALSIQTSAKTPYGDEAVSDGFLYAYRAGSIEQPDNRALRAAHTLGVPIVYFVATHPGRYEALYPCYVLEDRQLEQVVLVSPGRMVGPMDEREPVVIDSPIERQYATREVKVRLHQRRFRWLVIPAYREQCAICQLKEVQLLDAAHIVGDPEPTGTPEIPNGLSLCSIHHRAFDHDLVGVSPDYEVHVSRRLLEDADGPMLDVLKTFQGSTIHVPKRRSWQPDRERLAARFERFQHAA
jgi:putative restriction endonuclease